MLTYPWKCTVLHCNHLGNTWKPLVPMTYHFDYHPRSRSGNNQSGGSSAQVVSRCFPGGYNVKLYISRGRLAWRLLAFLCCVYCIVAIISWPKSMGELHEIFMLISTWLRIRHRMLLFTYFCCWEFYSFVTAGRICSASDFISVCNFDQINIYVSECL